MLMRKKGRLCKSNEAHNDDNACISTFPVGSVRLKISMKQPTEYNRINIIILHSR